MPKLTKTRVGAAVALLVALVAGALFAADRSHSAAPPELVPVAGVTSETLGHAGILLETPTEPAPTTTRATAIAAAQSYVGGAAVRDASFAHCVIQGLSID